MYAEPRASRVFTNSASGVMKTYSGAKRSGEKPITARLRTAVLTVCEPHPRSSSAMVRRADSIHASYGALAEYSITLPVRLSVASAANLP